MRSLLSLLNREALMKFLTEPQKVLLTLCEVTRLKFIPHMQTEVEAVYLLRGWSELIVSGKSYRLQAGDLGVIFPYQIHEFRADSEDLQAILLMATEQQLLGESTGRFDCLPSSPVLCQAGGEHPAVRALCSALSEFDGRRPYRSQLLQEYLTVFSLELLRSMELTGKCVAHDDTVHQALAYCNEHYREPLTLECVADALFVSRSYLSHLFHEKVGFSFRDYVNYMRVQEACRLLMQPENLPMAELASRVGFGSLRSFNRAFRDFKEVSPIHYRHTRRIAE